MLLSALESEAHALARESLDVTFRNPFWEERYAERGRRLSTEDSLYHLTYLREALAVGSPATLIAYARWLRRVLVARGMCSLHLADHLRCLGRTIERRGIPDGALAGSYLDAAADGLRPDDPAAGALFDAAVRSSREGDEDDPVAPRYLTAYLADAVAAGKPMILGDYVRWCEGHLARHGRERRALDEALSAAERAASAVGVAMVVD